MPTHTALHPSIEFAVSNQRDEDEPMVFADRLGFQRVMGNLLSNAGRFARSKVAICAEPADGSITIDVDDDGCGIPESERHALSNRLCGWTITPASNRGVGLGLALVKRIVTQHGGSVQLLTSPLGGCRRGPSGPVTLIALRLDRDARTLPGSAPEPNRVGPIFEGTELLLLPQARCLSRARDIAGGPWSGPELLHTQRVAYRSGAP